MRTHKCYHTTHSSPQPSTYMYTGDQPGTPSCGLTLSSSSDSEAGSKAGSLLPLPSYVHVLSVGTCERGAVVLTAVESVSSSQGRCCPADQLVINLHLYTQVSLGRSPLIVADFGLHLAPDFQGRAAWSQWRGPGSWKSGAGRRLRILAAVVVVEVSVIVCSEVVLAVVVAVGVVLAVVGVWETVVGWPGEELQVESLAGM